MTRKFPFEIGDVIRFHLSKEVWINALVLDFNMESVVDYNDTFRYKIMHLDEDNFGKIGSWTEYKHEGSSNNFTLICSVSLEETS
jgi:hypothetical protein